MIIAGSLLMLAGCSRPSPRTPARDFDAEVFAWQKHNTQAAGPTAIRLPDGSCLDTRRLPVPWVAAKPEPVSTLNPDLVIAAPGKAVGIVPYEVAGGKTDGDGRPYDGRVWVGVAGWSRPTDDDLASWEIAKPARVEALIHGTPEQPAVKRLPLWPHTASLQAYQTFADEGAYVDTRRLTQCRDYGPEIRLIWCDVISGDQQFRYVVKLDASNLPHLPETLSLITHAVEHMRAPCAASGGKGLGRHSNP